jgi:hypothetical protein
MAKAWDTGLTWTLLNDYLHVAHHFSHGGNNIQVVIESSEVQWHVAIVLLDVHDVLLLLHKVLYGTTKKDISHDLYCQYSINRGDYNYPLSTTYGRNPILAAS